MWKKLDDKNYKKKFMRQCSYLCKSRLLASPYTARVQTDSKLKTKHVLVCNIIPVTGYFILLNKVEELLFIKI